jgi:hypothetical protein
MATAVSANKYCKNCGFIATSYSGLVRHRNRQHANDSGNSSSEDTSDDFKNMGLPIARKRKDIVQDESGNSHDGDSSPEQKTEADYFLADDGGVGEIEEDDPDDDEDLSQFIDAFEHSVVNPIDDYLKAQLKESLLDASTAASEYNSSGECFVCIFNRKP